ncbi:MAG: hypothetical protein M1829_000897 [Trizodia sp. TS-e1964]|nr:MAG: hypothetical protein M1829_000897 [Trizodia sp. TS-e1964]
MDQICSSDDAEICKSIIAFMLTMHRPISIEELGLLLDMPDEIPNDYEALVEIIALCGSFLTLRERTISFIHQSAKDYLEKKASNELVPEGLAEVHKKIVIQLTILYTLIQTRLLQSDTLVSTGLPSLEIKTRHHEAGLYDSGPIDVFLRNHFLHRLEALSLIKKISDGVLSLCKLIDLLKKTSSNLQLFPLVQDAHRFVLSFRNIIENAPLQAYSSALLFSPSKSLIRNLFQHEEPRWVTVKPAMEANWDDCIHTFYGHSSEISSIAFSVDGTRLVSGSNDQNIKIWDTNTSTCLKTFKGHSDKVTSVAFSHDGSKMVSGSSDNTVKLWDVVNGVCLKTLDGHSRTVYFVAFLQGDTKIASASDSNARKLRAAGSFGDKIAAQRARPRINSITLSHDGTKIGPEFDHCLVLHSHYGEKPKLGQEDNTFKLWDTDNAACFEIIESPCNAVYSVAFSHNSKQLVSGSPDGRVWLWNIENGACIKTFNAHSELVYSVAFLQNGTKIASGSLDFTAKIWDINNGNCLKIIGISGLLACPVSFSQDGTKAAASPGGNTARLWDTGSGAIYESFKNHIVPLFSVTLSHNGTKILSGSANNMVQLWDAENDFCNKSFEGHTGSVMDVAYSPDEAKIASGSYDKTVKLWDVETGVCLNTLTGHSDAVYCVAFSRDGAVLASGSADKSIMLWELKSGNCLKTLEGYDRAVQSVAFSHNDAKLASGSGDSAVKLWVISSGDCIKIFKGHSQTVSSVAFSHNDTKLALESYDDKIRIWETSSGICPRTLNIGHTIRNMLFDTTDLYLLTNVGTFSWDTSLGSHRALAAISSEKPQYHGYGLDANEEWINGMVKI